MEKKLNKPEKPDKPNKPPEFEKYLSAISKGLEVDNRLKEDIYKELDQSLDDKYNEYLVKGYRLEESVAYTLQSFEDPHDLARMFNDIYKDKCMPGVKRVVFSRAFMVASLFLIVIGAGLLVRI